MIWVASPADQRRDKGKKEGKTVEAVRTDLFLLDQSSDMGLFGSVEV